MMITLLTVATKIIIMMLPEAAFNKLSPFH